MNISCKRMVAILAAVVVFSTGAGLATAADGDGFVPLFDGKTLNGWQQRSGHAKYEVVDGVIVGTTVPNTPNSFLCTEKFYGNFELELDFKVDPGMNSGVQIRSNATTERREVWAGAITERVYGYQVEIDPSDRAYTGGIYDEARRGWLNDLSKNEPARKAFKQNEWNHFRIVCNGDSIKTWLNGVPAADLKDDMTAMGFISLQVHGIGRKKDPAGEMHQVRWRNIMIKELP